ncbi:MAG TPA: rhodanese-like domain-containing protein [bacterium]|nr:rhodanese-like domain-containing protein [bacterium]
MALDKEEVLKRMNDREVVVLNILPKGDFRKLRIKGSENLSLTKDLDEFCREATEKYGKDRRFILYGERFGLLDSFLATRALVARGVNAENYPGGILEWHRAGMPVEGTDTPGGAE